MLVEFQCVSTTYRGLPIDQGYFLVAGADGAYADTHASKFPDQPMGWTEDWSWFAT